MKINVLLLASINGATIYLSTQFTDIWRSFYNVRKNYIKFCKVFKTSKRMFNVINVLSMDNTILFLVPCN